MELLKMPGKDLDLAQGTGEKDTKGDLRWPTTTTFCPTSQTIREMRYEQMHRAADTGFKELKQ